MRILLDESPPRKLALEFIGYETQTVQKRGWSGLSNGEFQVPVTGDRNLEFQQNPAALPIAVIVLIASNNRVIPPV